VIFRVTKRAAFPPAGEPIELLTWSYEDAAGRVHAVSPTSYHDMKVTRSNIAAARKAFGGAKFAKVVVDE
jgi:hypothetical protein